MDVSIMGYPVIPLGQIQCCMTCSDGALYMALNYTVKPMKKECFGTWPFDLYKEVVLLELYVQISVKILFY